MVPQNDNKIGVSSPGGNNKGQLMARKGLETETGRSFLNIIWLIDR